MRSIIPVIGEYYHVYNRGVDKRNIVMDQDDAERLKLSMIEFNTIEPIKSIFKHQRTAGIRRSLAPPTVPSTAPLVEFIAYSNNPNHYHLLVRQLVEGGIQKCMHRLGTGYTNYFNEKYDRTGSLFQGSYRAKHIPSNEYLLYVSAYMNRNDKVHGIAGDVAALVRSSWEEYVDERVPGICSKDIILGQFETRAHYQVFCEAALANIIEKKENEKELNALLLE